MKMQTRQEALVAILESYINDVKSGQAKLDNFIVTTKSFRTFAHVDVNFSVDIPLWEK